MEPPPTITRLEAAIRKRGRRLELKKSPNRVLRSQTPRQRRKPARFDATTPKIRHKEHSQSLASTKNQTSDDMNNTTQDASTSLIHGHTNNTIIIHDEPQSFIGTVENCENFSPSRNEADLKLQRKKSTANPVRSPVQAMLRQLQSDLSPKYMSPTTPPSSVRCSRYGRAQKSKETMDFLDTDVALAVRKSINEKNASSPPITPTRITKTATKSIEDSGIVYNMDLKKSPPTRKEYVSPIQSLILRNQVVRDVIEKAGSNTVPMLGEDYDRKSRLVSRPSNEVVNNVAAKNTRQITDRSCRISPQSTHKMIDFDSAIDRSVIMKSIKSPETNQLDSLLTKKTVSAGSTKPRRVNIPMPPLFSESTPAAASTNENSDTAHPLLSQIVPLSQSLDVVKPLETKSESQTEASQTVSFIIKNDFFKKDPILLTITKNETSHISFIGTNNNTEMILTHLKDDMHAQPEKCSNSLEDVSDQFEISNIATILSQEPFDTEHTFKNESSSIDFDKLITSNSIEKTIKSLPMASDNSSQTADILTNDGVPATVSDLSIKPVDSSESSNRSKENPDNSQTLVSQIESPYTPSTASFNQHNFSDELVHLPTSETFLFPDNALVAQNHSTPTLIAVSPSTKIISINNKSTTITPCTSVSTTPTRRLSFVPTEVFKKPTPKSYARNKKMQHSAFTSPSHASTSPRRKHHITDIEENAVDFLLGQYETSPKLSPNNRRRLLSLNRFGAHESNEISAESQPKVDRKEATSALVTLEVAVNQRVDAKQTLEDHNWDGQLTDVQNEEMAKIDHSYIDNKTEILTVEDKQQNHSFDGDTCPSVSSEDSAKGSSIADEEQKDKIVDIYNVGDLAWARIGNYPYWPCLVCNTPDGGSHISYTTAKKPIKRIHIRFLADNGRRSWTPINCMMPFKSIEDFEAKKQELPSNIKAKDPRVRAFTVSQAKMILWSQAIVEAQMLAVFPQSRRPSIFENKLDNDTKPTSKPITDKRFSTASIESFDSLFTGNMERNYTSTPCITSLGQMLDAQRDFTRSPTPDSPEYEELTIHLPDSDNTETNNKIQNYLLSLSTDGSTSPVLENTHLDAAADEVTSYQVSDNMLAMANDKDFLAYFRNTKKHFMDDCDTRTEMHLKHLAIKMFMLEKIKDSSKPGNSRKRNHTMHEDSLAVPVAKRKKVDDPPKSNRSSLVGVRKSNRMSIGEYKAKRLSGVEEETAKNRNSISLDETTAALAAKAALRAARAADKEKRELEEMSKYFMKQYPKNILFKGLNRELVCRFCYQTGELLKCQTSSCNEYMHHLCATDPEAAAAKMAATKLKKKTISKNEENSRTVVHVTADSISEPMEVDTTLVGNVAEITQISGLDSRLAYCPDCAPTQGPVCFVCKTNDGSELRCTEKSCGRQFHVDCLKYWPQNKIVSDHQLLCPCHVCHTCISDDPRGKYHHTKSSKLIKCVKCPATYHINSSCIPAGCQLLTSTQLICPRHRVENRKPVNANWCFICSRGGELVCCETCPTAFHAECLRVPVPDTCYICEECETGRYPLYGEIVWAKIGSCKWWPAVVVPPSEIPDTILAVKRQPHNFAVRFFGARNYSWISRGFVFLYQEEDSDYTAVHDGKPDKVYDRALVEAKEYAAKLRAINEMHVDPEKDRFVKPLPYTKIKTNRPIAPVRLNVACDEDDERVCQCTPKDDDPCGPQSSCLNRALSIECDAATCPAGSACQNQRFEKRLYPNLVERRTEGKGWGLVTLDDIPAGAFIIEYVGEMINQKEFERRIAVMQQVKDEHYYFMTVNGDLMIDAGPRGNSARFINHSCEPNCETQYWLVKGNTRVGLFALVDIPANTELTFNYNLECIGELKKICFCGASKCAGFIGAKFTEPQKPADSKRGRGRKTSQKHTDNPPKKKKTKKKSPPAQSPAINPE